MEYKEFMEQWKSKAEHRERRRWRNDTVKWSDTTAEILGATNSTVLTLRNQIKAAACQYADTGNQEDWESASMAILQMVDMLEEHIDERM